MSRRKRKIPEATRIALNAPERGYLCTPSKRSALVRSRLITVACFLREIGKVLVDRGGVPHHKPGHKPENRIVDLTVFRDCQLRSGAVWCNLVIPRSAERQT